MRKPSALRANYGVVAVQYCPNCGTHVNAAAAANGETVEPIEGDVTVCFNCAYLLVFDARLRANPLTEAYWLTLDADYKQMIRTIQSGIRERGVPWTT